MSNIVDYQMLRPRVVLFWLGLAGIAIGGWLCWAYVDWASYGPAQPPTSDEVIDQDSLQLVGVALGGQAIFDAPCMFQWSQTLNVHLEGTSKPGTFQLRPQQRQYKGQRGTAPRLPVAALRLQILRRSSLQPGYVVVSQTGSNPDVKPDGKLEWDDRIWIPNVPGKYRARLLLVVYHHTGGVQHTDVSSLAVCEIQVTPGPESG